MSKGTIYTQDQVEDIAQRAARYAVEQANFGNRIEPSPEGDDDMTKRIKQQVQLNGTQHWITGQTIGDLLNSYLSLCLSQGVVAPPIAVERQPVSSSPLFGAYLKNFNEIYKSKQQSLTKTSREQIAKNHIIPKWGRSPIDSIKTSDLQLWFNDLESQGYSHETLLKIKNNMNPALDAAVEDGYISRNPLRSTRLNIGGAETVHHKAIPSDKMKEIRIQISDIEDDRVRRMATLLCNTGMRLEEILGLKWEDIDFIDNWIYIQRAVVHPTRNMPEVKCPKSVSSKRRVPLTNTIKIQLGQKYSSGFVLHSDDKDTRKCPLSYTEARRCVKKIKDLFGLQGYSAHDFRDTCATEWREAGVPTDIIARLLGHTKSDITENRYVKYRDEIFQGVRDIMEIDLGTQNGTNLQV